MAAKRGTAKKPEPKAPTPAEKLAAVGLEPICERIENGESQAEIAKDLGVSQATLSGWLNRDEHAERASRARAASAEAWLDRGLQVVQKSLSKKGSVDPTAAKAFAQECARRAALRNPRYIEKTAHEVTGAGGAPLQHEHTHRLPEAVARALDAIAGAAEAGSAQAPVPD